MPTATFKIWRTHPEGDGTFQSFRTEVVEGMVVLDVVLKIQAEQASDLAVRWNCKAGKCGSCSAEINGMPKLMCMTRLSTFDLHKPVTVEPMRAFPPVRDLVTDVSWNFRVKTSIKKFKPRPPDAPDGTWRMKHKDVDRGQEFRMCIVQIGNELGTNRPAPGQNAHHGFRSRRLFPTTDHHSKPENTTLCSER